MTKFKRKWMEFKDWIDEAKEGLWFITILVAISVGIASCNSNDKEDVMKSVCVGTKATYIYKGTEFSCFDGVKVK